MVARKAERTAEYLFKLAIATSEVVYYTHDITAIKSLSSVGSATTDIMMENNITEMKTIKAAATLPIFIRNNMNTGQRILQAAVTITRVLFRSSNRKSE